MTNMTAFDVWSGLLAQAQSVNEGQLLEHVRQAKSCGARFEVTVHAQPPRFIQDDSPYTELVEHCALQINGTVAQEWSNTYWGYHGGMGAGWWVELNDTTLDASAQRLLQCLNLLPPTPQVPPSPSE